MQEALDWPFPIKGYRSYVEMIEDQQRLPEAAESLSRVSAG